jgi:hypothetical protein
MLFFNNNRNFWKKNKFSFYQKMKFSNSLKKDFKTPIEKILKDSSLQFLLRPIKSLRKLIKIMWIVFLVVFFFIAIYLCYKNIQSYLNFDVITSIYENVEKEPEFPTVTFCNEFIKYSEIKFIGVEFNLVELTDTWKNHFEKYEDISFGTCYRFNSGLNISNQSIEIKKSKRKGRQSGFQLDFYFDSKRDYGEMIVFIHNHTQMPLTVYNKGYVISAGCRNYFDVERKIVHKLENPYNDCYKNVSESPFDKTIIDFIRKKYKAYTQKECLELCRNFKFNETNSCNCTLKDLEENIFKTCYKTEREKCINTFMNDFNKLDLCMNYCPLECDSFRYEINQIIKPLLATGNCKDCSKTYEFNFETYEYLTKKYFSLDVYYNDLKYTLITQQPRMDLFDLISSIAGILGLFIGFSFITCLEIFEVIFEVIYLILY